jgi:hypothetical protein
MLQLSDIGLALHVLWTGVLRGETCESCSLFSESFDERLPFLFARPASYGAVFL